MDISAQVMMDLECKLIITEEELDKDVVNFQYKSYTIYIINSDLSSSHKNSIYKKIRKEGENWQHIEKLSLASGK